MPGPVVQSYAIPTGGVVRLQMPEYMESAFATAQMTISRAVSGSTGLSAFSTIYSGGVLPVFLDVGDGTAAPLDGTTNYVWRVTDSRGSTQTPAITPTSSIETKPDQLTEILIRSLQGAINTATIPEGIPIPTVAAQMPQGGLLAMPFIVVNLDLIQQQEVSIGEDVPNPDQYNNWTLYANAKRIWRVSVEAANAEQRDFYRDYLLVVFRVLKATAFGPMGLDIRHRFQAASYTDVKEWEGQSPGFYGADLMLEIDGIFPTAVLTNYGPTNHILFTATVGSVAGEPVTIDGQFS